jgi:hypothetical protein
MTKKSLRLLLGAAAVLGLLVTAPLPAAAAGGAAYYVSASGGDDGNPGTESAPWQSLANISATVFDAGDTVYLKRGEIFEGAVTLNGVGSAASPITLTSYGGGDRPHIKGPGEYVPCVTVAPDAQGWRIVGLEISGGGNGIEIRAGGSAANDSYSIKATAVPDNLFSKDNKTTRANGGWSDYNPYP